MNHATLDTALHAIALLAKALTTAIFIRMAFYVVEWLERRKATRQTDAAFSTVMKRMLVTMENSQNDGKMGDLIKLEPKDKK